MESHALKSTDPYIVDGEFLRPLTELGTKVLDSQDTVQFRQLRSTGDYSVEMPAGSLLSLG